MAADQRTEKDEPTRAQQEGHIDKSILALPSPKRIRDKEHLRSVATRPCLICGRMPCQAHHVRFAQPRAFGRKVSDEWAVPLCAFITGRSTMPAMNDAGGNVTESIRWRWRSGYGARNKF